MTPPPSTSNYAILFLDLQANIVKNSRTADAQSLTRHATVLQNWPRCIVFPRLCLRSRRAATSRRAFLKLWAKATTAYIYDRIRGR